MGLTGSEVLVWYIGWQKVSDELASANLGLLLFAACLTINATWLRALKWRYALGPGHNAVGLFFMSKATGNWSPGRLGEFAPMALRRHRTPKIGAWIMLDRVLEIAVTLGLGLMGLYLINILEPEMYVLVFIVAISGGAGGIYILTRRDIFLAIADRLKTDGILHRFAMLFAAISEELVLFVKPLPGVLTVTILT